MNGITMMNGIALRNGKNALKCLRLRSEALQYAKKMNGTCSISSHFSSVSRSFTCYTPSYQSNVLSTATMMRLNEKLSAFEGNRRYSTKRAEKPLENAQEEGGNEGNQTEEEIAKKFAQVTMESLTIYSKLTPINLMKLYTKTFLSLCVPTTYLLYFFYGALAIVAPLSYLSIALVQTIIPRTNSFARGVAIAFAQYSQKRLNPKKIENAMRTIVAEKFEIEEKQVSVKLNAMLTQLSWRGYEFHNMGSRTDMSPTVFYQVKTPKESGELFLHWDKKSNELLSCTYHPSSTYYKTNILDLTEEAKKQPGVQPSENA
eukprot:TRINITY_DN4404_c0_g2_i2.p1 TRINITY_DN4404_c0_g2~~TRINITY_DN4404_c0_g2_i2.p1  ORF type:complete len:316 (+),score=89.65 TRINITY_DN4404_c0_g2_i2:133-1080(+)